MYTTVVTSTRQAGIRSGLTYDTGDLLVTPGSLVRVPLRRSFVEGIVSDIQEARKEEEFDVKNVQEVLGDAPLLPEFHIRTMQWMAEYYLTTLRHVLSVWLPAPPWQSLLPKALVGYRLTGEADVKGKKQQIVLRMMHGRGWVSAAEIRERTGATKATLAALVDKGILIEETQSEASDRHAVMGYESFVKNSPDLPDAHQRILVDIQKEKQPSLLTGDSDRHAIYAHLITETIRSGKQALLLVPEILLTESFTKEMGSIIDPRITSVLHSRLTIGQRRHEWKRIHRGDVALVIGSRTALFAPLQNVGLIILDEEHERTYKSEQTPRYHTRDVAEVLSRNAKAKFVLGSLTPTVESWAKTKSNAYHVAKLPPKEASSPKVRIIDLATVQFGKLYPFSAPLLEAIADRLQRKEQIVLLLNRRGTASSILCLDCRRRIVSQQSQLPYTLHQTQQGKPFLFDHTTGERTDVPARCPHCDSTRLQPIGAGTQRIESMLAQVFPNAKILRADRDTITKPEDRATILRQMRTGQADILLGTQTVVRGLDLPNVTLAAVLVADVGLSVPDFRAGERVFQLLMHFTQCCSATTPADVFIQTFRPDAPEIVLSASRDTAGYLDRELKLRLFTNYPPAQKMIRLLISGRGAQELAKNTFTALRAKAPVTVQVRAAPTMNSAGREWHILIRGENPRELLHGLDLKDIVIDVDPLEIV